MKVRDLFKQLSFNELSNMTIGSEGSGSVNSASYERLINQTNSALVDLYSRFTLSEKELIIETLDWKSQYVLRKQHAVTDSTTDVLKYIIDSPADPFLGDVLAVLTVRNEVGHLLPVNDSERIGSVFTPQPDCIQFTHLGSNQAFFVGYRAKHEELKFDSENPENCLEQEIRLPLVLEAALRFKIAEYIYSPMAGQEMGPKTKELSDKYELECIKVQANGLISPPDQSTNIKLHRRGFV